MKLRCLFLSFLCSFSIGTGFGQKGVTTFGLQYKPIIPNRFIGTYEQEFNEGVFQSSIKQKMGHSFGGVIRMGLNKTISLETGLSITQRNFGLNFDVPDSGLTAKEKLTVVSYEIPVSCLVYIQLSRGWYINTSLGSALTLFPSNVRVVVPLQAGEVFRQEGAYKSKVQGAMLANVGFEYRTKDKGYFYLGTSYHLPYTEIMTFAMAYEYFGGKIVSIDKVLGSYLTVDLRYFFHENPAAKTNATPQ